MSLANLPENLADLPNRFDYAEAQPRIYAYWEQAGCFHSEPDPQRKPFTIVIPPPNVTGALHLGHALNNTLQDVLIRYKRMAGFNALWMPGTDHAGIATQAVVERRLLEEEGKTRHDLGREQLVKRIWQWKDAYEDRIISQLKQMGCGCDWQRTRFTLDDVCARAVRQTFFDLFRRQLIYRGKRLVNWDAFLQTAVSDDEVFHETVQGHFWHFRYPVIDPQPGEPKFVAIATTRPETMLGDRAVAVHPEPATALDRLENELEEKLEAAPAKDKEGIQAQIDNVRERRRTMLPQLEQLRDMALDGRKVMLPLMERPIPLVADEWAKPELGSGCVKVTPAHDENDLAVWERHPEIGRINIMNQDGTLNENVPEQYRGLTMSSTGRKQVLADLAKLTVFDPEIKSDVKLYDPETDAEDREIDLAHSDRSKTPIEPYLADQWFVRMDQLAQSAMDAVTDGRVKIVPERYAKGYLDWLGEKRDWCIGRQLWWGHQIPVWQVTLRYQQDTGSVATSLKQVAAEFQEALAEFATACGVSGELVASRSGESTPPNYFICAKTERAEKALNNYCRRRNASKLVAQGDTVPPADRYLPDDDPRKAADIRLTAVVAIMNEQDKDVLDTWFSSALWPHSTLGWPGPEWEKMQYYYPTSVLITSRDIITLWVARMVLMGLNNVGEIPFHEVFIHPKILDGYGETMSKSKGNGVDPLDVIEKFGADALRFALAYITTENQDARMPVQFECPHCEALIEQTKKNRALPRVACPKCGKEFSTQWASKEEDLALPRGPVVSERFESARNFCNKLWNASRFAMINLEGYTHEPVSADALKIEDRWILSRLSTVTQTVSECLDTYRYAEAARALYDFAWDEFCSFFVEMVKQRLQDPAERGVAQRVMAHTLGALLRLLHPMVPFITEQVWQLLGQVAPERGLDAPEPAPECIMDAAWPQIDDQWQDPRIEDQFAQFQAALGALREIRSRQNIAPRLPIEFAIRCEPQIAELLQPMEPYFASLSKATAMGWGSDVQPPATSAHVSLNGMDVYVDLKDFIDEDAERARLEKERERLAKQIEGKQKKLATPKFVERAPAEVVQRERDGLAQLTEKLAAVETGLEKLGA